MAKEDKKNAKNTKAEPKQEAKKDDWKEQKPDNSGTQNNSGNNGGCSSMAKVLIYLIPLALYVPWAYRMFKGNPCCSEVPKCPTALSQGCPSSATSAPFSRIGHRFRAPQDQCGAAPPACNEWQQPQPQQQESDCGKSKVEVDKEREECLDHSKQCLEKCMEKCFDADRVEKKKKKKRKDKERKCEEEDDDDD